MPQPPILEKTHYHQSNPKSSTDPTDQRKTKNKQTNRPTPTTNPPQPTKPNQSTTTTAWSSQHHSHQPLIHFSQHPLARLQIFPIIFFASRSHGLHNQNLKDQPLICSLLVEIGCKVLSRDEIFRLERKLRSYQRCVVEKKANLVSSGQELQWREF